MYSSYIYKVLKHVHVVHPDTGISNKVMAILNSFVNHIFKCIATEASKLSAYSKKSTISSQKIRTAVWLILPGECLKHAISGGTKSVSKFSSICAKKTDLVSFCILSYYILLFYPLLVPSLILSPSQKRGWATWARGWGTWGVGEMGKVMGMDNWVMGGMEKWMEKWVMGWKNLSL